MAFWAPSGPRKRRTREHVIADLSVNHVERLVLRCGWTAERTRYDYGLDLQMDTYNADGEPESGHVLFQLKATDRPNVRDRGQAIAVRLDGRDIVAWSRELMPVILIVYDAGEDHAYWLHMQSYFAGRPRTRHRTGATTTVRLPVHQILNEAALREFGALRDAVVSRFWRVLAHEQ